MDCGPPAGKKAAMSPQATENVDLLFWLPDDLFGQIIRELLHGDVASKRALMQLAQTTRPLRTQVHSLAKAEPAMASITSKKKSELRKLTIEERRQLKFTAAMAVTLCYNPAALSGAPPESIAHALAPSPWCEWNKQEQDEVIIENYLYDLAPNSHKTRLCFREGLASLPPALIAIAASDMADEQKHFFLGQSVGEMIIECDRHLSVDGAARLGKVLAVRPLMKASDFIALVWTATQIQEHPDLGPESSYPLALIASWCKTALAQPRRLSFRPRKWMMGRAPIEKVALQIRNGAAACTFSRVLQVILEAMPSQVATRINEETTEEQAVEVPRGTPRQYDTLLRWLHAAMLAVDSALDGSASTEADDDEVQLRKLILHQVVDLTRELFEVMREELEELASLPTGVPLEEEL